MDQQKRLINRFDRMTSYSLQINETCNLPGLETILEVGSGNGFFSLTMNWLGYKVETCDIDKNYNPDYLGDIRKLKIDKKFDIVVSFEMLQHVPFKDFEPILRKLKNLSNRYVFLSLPHHCPNKLVIKIKLPNFIKKIRLPTDIQFMKIFGPKQKNLNYVDNRSHLAHYWEINRKGYDKKKILSSIKRSGLNVIKKFHNIDHPHHFFILCEIEV